MEETKTIQKLQDEQKTIYYNYILLEWYIKDSKKIMLDDNHKQKIFSLMSNAYLEDPYCFLRIMLYIANTRSKDSDEIAYKIMIHFLGIMMPDVIMNNIELFTTIGKKMDVIYFLQCNVLTNKVLKWIRHKAKYDNDYAVLSSGKFIDVKSIYKIRYKAKRSDIKSLLLKILDEPLFNGLMVMDNLSVHQ